MTVAIYHCKKCGQYSCREYCHDKGYYVWGPSCFGCNNHSETYVHIDTVDPAVIISRWLNGDKQVEGEIKGGSNGCIM